MMFHLGILVILILSCYTVYLLSQDWEKGYEWYVPLGAGTLLWLIFEAFYWVIKFFFILN